MKHFGYYNIDHRIKAGMTIIGIEESSIHITESNPQPYMFHGAPPTVNFVEYTPCFNAFKDVF